MTALDVLSHELIGIDAHGMLCSCGARSTSWLEHLGVVALHELGAPELSPRRRRPTDDELWWAAQSRRENLASFASQPSERRLRRPRYKFTPEQEAIALRAAERAA